MNRYLLAALAAALIVIWGGWQKIQRQAENLSRANDQVATLERAAESRRNTQRLLAQIDTEHTQERERANQANASLRADVATGNRRLSVLAASCPVRAAAGSASLDHAEARAELDPAAAERIVRIVSDGDDSIRALNTLIDYINTACPAAGPRTSK